MASVKGYTGVSISQPWEVVKEFDFTGHDGTHTFSDGVAYEWEGVDWTCRNLASYGTSIKFVNGAGLEMVVNAGATAAYANWYSTYMNCPLLEASIGDIVSGYDMSDTICLQTLLTSSSGGSYTPGDGQYQGSFLLITDGGYGLAPDASATANWLGVGCFANGDVVTTRAWTRYGGLTTPTAAPSMTAALAGNRFPTFYELITLPAGATSIGSAATTSSSEADVTAFPDPLTTTEFRAIGHKQETYGYQITNMPGGTNTAAPSYDLRPSNLKVALSSRIYTGSPPNTMTFTTVFSKLRVLRRPRYDL
tara:strand:+ start:379 stop:1299 length:921 start_codon:yes stop_codon:yes gene_type:complete